MSNATVAEDIASDVSLLTVGISSRALFDLGESHRVFEEKGLQAYSAYQIEREQEVLPQGMAFGLVKKLLALNDLLPDGKRVEVILLSRNSSDTGLRIFNSIEHYGLDIIRAAFTNGEGPDAYIPAFEADLFLSSNPQDVRKTLQAGFAAASILPSGKNDSHPQQVRIAFDGDSVLFSDEAERVYKEDGLQAFVDSETRQALQPLSGGPFKRVLSAVHSIQKYFPVEDSPIRTALVTARSAPAHKRVILTLRRWGIRIDEALFLGGLPKGAFLKAFGADIFFDDQRVHCESAAEHVTTGHVPHGVSNEE